MMKKLIEIYLPTEIEQKMTELSLDQGVSLENIIETLCVSWIKGHVALPADQAFWDDISHPRNSHVFRQGETF